MTPTGGLFDGVLARGDAAAAVADSAWLRAMLDTEAALARAEAAVGLMPADQAEQIAAACGGDFPLAELGADAAASGNPAVPLVRALIERVAAPASAQVHRGATSQDILDTAAMLVSRRALDPLLGDLGAAADAARRLADEWRDSAMVGRTLLQQAVPITFGLKAAGWLVALDEAAGPLTQVRDERLAVQLGGAAGTLAALGDSGPAGSSALARELGLAEPLLPWHTVRNRIGELAGALAVASGAVAKIAGDVVLLSQTEIGEVREGRAGAGGSSTMPHKRNPVAAVSAIACARQAPGLAATLFAAMEQEHERAAGAWHAEWQPLSALLRSTGSATAWIRECLEQLVVDERRMRDNLEASGGELLAERVVGALAATLGRKRARDLVTRIAAEEHGASFAERLASEPEVAAQLGPGEIASLLDPYGYLGSASGLVDRALRAHGAS